MYFIRVRLGRALIMAAGLAEAKPDMPDLMGKWNCRAASMLIRGK